MKIYIQKPFESSFDGVKIWVIKEIGPNRCQVTIDKESGNLKALLIDPDNPKELEPFLKLPTELFNEFVKAITEYASDNNIKTENENLLQGKLGATEKHLEDMRKIVFKDYEKS